MFAFGPEQIEALRALLVGFAFAGFLASLFQWLTEGYPSFRLLQQGGVAGVASVPIVVFAAPFIIMRNTVRGRRFERRPFFLVMMATIIAGFWSIAEGRVLMLVLLGF